MTDEELDARILAGAGPQWRKVAALLGVGDWKSVSEKKFDERLLALISAGKLDVAGDPLSYRFAEVRLAAAVGTRGGGGNE